MTISVQTTTLSRRKLLCNAGSLVAAVSVASIPALAVPKPETNENPTLLALGPKIEAAEAKFLDAMARYQEAYEAGSKLWPRAPKAAEGYQRDMSKYSFGGAIIERDIAGRGIQQHGRSDCRNIVTAAALKNNRPQGDAKLIAAWRERLSEVRAYERACKRANELSGFRKASKAREVTGKQLERLIIASVKEPASTMQGLVVKARAMQSYRLLEKRFPYFSLEARFWGPSLADAMLSVLPQA